MRTRNLEDTSAPDASPGRFAFGNEAVCVNALVPEQNALLKFS